MSHIIANPTVETDMTNYFVCKLYQEDHNSMEVRNNGMDPYKISTYAIANYYRTKRFKLDVTKYLLRNDS
ncbi:MAG: hypothetical protein WAM14_12265 [Candidatus Nitrosopolaris sp.]